MDTDTINLNGLLSKDSPDENTIRKHLMCMIKYYTKNKKI